MQDRLLHGSMRVTILGLITLMAGSACVVAYLALLACFSGDLSAAGGRLIATIGLVSGAGAMLRYRGELIDERHR